MCVEIINDDRSASHGGKSTINLSPHKQALVLFYARSKRTPNLFLCIGLGALIVWELGEVHLTRKIQKV